MPRGRVAAAGAFATPPRAAAPPARAVAARQSALPTPPAPSRLSYSALAAHARCGYRFYLERLLRLPEEREDVPPGEAAGVAMDPRERGTLVHAVLEELDYELTVPPEPETVARVAAVLGLRVSPGELRDVERLVRNFVEGPVRERLARAASVRRELDFAFALEATGPLVSGVMDVHAVEQDGGVLVVDFKTDRDLGEYDYAIQRQVYALAALIAGAPHVEVTHLYLERPESPDTVRYVSGQAAVLAAELAATARPLLEGEYLPAAEPHLELCAGCPGRRALCHHPTERTGRPRATL